MKFNINWLRDHLETNSNLEEIESSLEKLGFVSEDTLKTPQAWKEIEIVKIINKEKHPNADKLNIYEIELKNGSTEKIVCGDSSLEISDHVPYAKPGIEIPSNKMKIKTAKIRGIESPGMLCSAGEINLPLEQTGVLKCFCEDFGKSIAQAYEEEGILDIEVTPNRGDMLSVRGVARALSQFGIGTLKELKTTSIKEAKTDCFEVKSDKCLAFHTALLKHEASQTKAYIKKRLAICGFGYKDIDLIDLTNYIAHEIGNPMHAFDHSKIEGKIEVTKLEKEEAFKTLKQEELKLEKGSLVIKDDKKIISWPGIIGAENSKTSSESNEILLEAGIFIVDSIQRRKNKLNTHAAKLFERGVDPLGAKVAIERFLYLIGKEAEWMQSYESQDFAKKIPFSPKFIKEILGIEIEKDNLKKILEKKGFKISQTEVEVPSYRFFDVSTPNCIVEEVASGSYDEIECKNLSPKIVKKQKESLEEKIKACAITLGFDECYSFSLASQENSEFKIENAHRKVRNALSSNYSVLRGSLIPSLCKALEWHKKNNYSERKFFESGLIFEREQRKVFAAISENHKDLLKIFYTFLEAQEKTTPSFKTSDAAHLKAGIEFHEEGKTIAVCGEIKKDILKDFDLKQCFSLEIEIENLGLIKTENKKTPTDQAPVYKDITFELKENIEVGKPIKSLKEKNYSFELLGIYPNEKINEKRKVTLRFKFQEKETLSKEKIESKMQKIEKIISENS